ncbi:MAG: hypothetical protein ACTSQ9_06955 [Candidatus Hodarchaeales archaeon]
MRQRDDIHRELTRLLKSDTSIKITLLGDRTGLTIARASRLLALKALVPLPLLFFVVLLSRVVLLPLVVLELCWLNFLMAKY